MVSVIYTAGEQHKHLKDFKCCIFNVFILYFLIFIFEVINNAGNIKRIIVMNCKLSNKMNVNIWRLVFCVFCVFLSISFLIFQFWTFSSMTE